MKRFHKLLVPLDFQTPTGIRLRLAATLVRHFEAEVTLLHVNESSDTDMSATLERAASDDLEGVSSKCIVMNGDAARAIVETARREACDLIVLFPRSPIGSAT